ncbi:MAG: hypothetical protein HND52_11320 [Ignavibacteriae bacterium]|nr:hypothetical protein [Ignavibacteriota bacterium]NOG98538.1 hypothetical protein [Ignavibacteriota bacterium]
MSNFPFGFKHTEHTCSDGSENKNHPVDFECTYSGLGWLLFSIGMSAKPTRVDFICTNCKKIIYTSTDSKILNKYVGR